MATYGDFSSLLQLGVGIGVGLSVFRAPVDLWTAKLEKIFDMEIRALRGNSVTGFRHKKRQALQTLRFKYFGVRRVMERRIMPFMFVAAAGAVANLWGLIEVALHAGADAGNWGEVFIFISSIYYIIILCALWFFALWHLREISGRLKKIQLSTEAKPLFE